MKTPNYKEFFENYVDTFNRSILTSIDTDSIRANYAEYFVSASSGGVVEGCGNDQAYAGVLGKGAEFYRGIGLCRLSLSKIDIMQIDGEHDMVRPSFSSAYLKRDGRRVTVDFDVVYMIQRRRDGLKIFASVTGDEMALLGLHGLVDKDGNIPTG